MASTIPSSGSAAVDDGASGSITRGIVAELFTHASSPGGIWLAILLTSIIALPLLSKLLNPQLDPREPPLLKARIPWIGHIIGIIRHQTDYHRILHTTNPSKPIVTLPMLNGKLYAVFDPHLIQSILRNKVASNEPFITDFAQKIFGLSAETFAKITSNPSLIPDFTDAIHASFQTDMLHKMNVNFLGGITSKLGPLSDGTAIADVNNSGSETLISGGLQVDNLYLWCRDVMSLATTQALYGDGDPFIADPSLVETTWIFEESVPSFFISPLPSITLRKAFQARKRLQDVLKSYYAKDQDLNNPSTSQLVLNRANELRKHGFTGEEIGSLEAILPVVATTNAVPTSYWLLLHVLARPDLVAQVRAEIEKAASISHDESGKRVVSFNIARFDDQLPLLISCYRETMRLSNHSVSNRRVMSDLVVKGADGQSYLLKKGTDIQLPAGVTHYEHSIWGQDVSTFVPDRFLPAASLSAPRDKTAESIEVERRKKLAYFPFGGGRHLCPGRNLAFAEILGFTCIMLLGFDIEPTGMGFADMEMSPPLLASGTVKPKNRGIGLGGRLLRRKEWENVQWHFEC
ncbi:cytochrome P450 [Mariannaea sp. PMI_226]|nr:cytochrome P450 [Mariannaea sp. PMI_226]